MTFTTQYIVRNSKNRLVKGMSCGSKVLYIFFLQNMGLRKSMRTSLISSHNNNSNISNHSKCYGRFGCVIVFTAAPALMANFVIIKIHTYV